MIHVWKKITMNATLRNSSFNGMVIKIHRCIKHNQITHFNVSMSSSVCSYFAGRLKCVYFHFTYNSIHYNNSEINYSFSMLQILNFDVVMSESWCFSNTCLEEGKCTVSSWKEFLTQMSLFTNSEGHNNLTHISYWWYLTWESLVCSLDSSVQQTNTSLPNLLGHCYSGPVLSN